MSSVPSSASAARSGRRFMLLSAACFVANVLLIRALGHGSVGVWTITAVRFASGLALCLIVHRRELDATALISQPRLILRGIVGGIATLGLYVTVVNMDVGRAIFINNTYVVFAALLAVPLLGEPLRASLIVSALLALAGLGLLTGALVGVWEIGRYEVIGLLVALASAWIVVAIRRLLRDGVSTPTVFASQCIYGLLFCAPFALREATLPSPGNITGLIAAGLCAAFGQLCMTHAYRSLPVAEGALLQTLVPFGIAAGGVLFFGETLTLHETAGGLLIVAATLLPVFLKPATTARSTPPPPRATPPAAPPNPPPSSPTPR